MAQYGACKVVVQQEQLFTPNNTYQRWSIQTELDTKPHVLIVYKQLIIKSL